MKLIKRTLLNIGFKLWAAQPPVCRRYCFRLISWLLLRLPDRFTSLAGRIITALRTDKFDFGKDYPLWIELFEKTDPASRELARAQIGQWPNRPLISILMPVFNPDPGHLRQAIQSVQDQFYSHWELCIADDKSTAPAIGALLRDAAGQDSRIRIAWRDTNGHIAAASNSALELATGSFIALLDHDDILSPRALYEVALRIVSKPDLDLIYSDEDHIDDNDRRYNPYFKPDWNPELMLGQNLINHLGVFRRSLVVQAGAFRLGFEGSQDYDLALRVIAATTPDRIAHIPHVLYHWRATARPTSFSQASLDRCVANGRRAVSQFLARDAPGARVEASAAVSAWNRVVYPVPIPAPLVSVVIPTRNHAALLAKTVDGLLHKTDYPSLEILIVDNGSDEPAALDLLRDLAVEPGVQVLRAPGPYNFAALNNLAARQAKGDLLLLLNNDIEVIKPDWLNEMVSHAVRPGIGAVGAKLLYPDKTIQHGGVTIGVLGVASHQYLHKSYNDAGYFGQLALARDVSAVTGACMLLRRQLYQDVGGLDEVSLPVAFNDIDLCLKLMQSGYRNVWTPYAELFHLESASRGSDLVGEKAERFGREVAHMKQKWGRKLQEDPFWNPNLSLESVDIGLAFPPRAAGKDQGAALDPSKGDAL